MTETRQQKPNINDGILSLESGAIYAALLSVATVLAYFSPEWIWGLKFERTWATSTDRGIPHLPFDTMSVVQGTMYQLCSMMAVSLPFLLVWITEDS
jgi:hypothetical protein